jgi:hypothetical protein
MARRFSKSRCEWVILTHNAWLPSCRKLHVDVLEYLLFLNLHDEFTYRMSFGGSCLRAMCLPAEPAVPATGEG